MSSSQITKLRREARECEMQVIERAEPGGLHVIVIGERVVHWWPESKRMTAYVEGAAQGQKFAAARDVIELANKKD